jgi:hypothetical protein
MKKEIEVWYSEYELRRFIDMAMRWGIEGVYKDRKENRPFTVFTYYIENARTNFELFATQLNNKLTKNNNWKAIEIDLKNRFVVGINQYINWYKINQKELEKFQPNCPYSLMLNVIESTKAEILKYFPEIESNTQQQQTFIELNTEPNKMGNQTVSKLQFEKEKNFFSMRIGEPEYIKKIINGKEISIPSWGTKNLLKLTPENWEQNKAEFLESKLNIESPSLKGFTRLEKLQTILIKLPEIQTTFYNTLLNRFKKLIEVEILKEGQTPQPIQKTNEKLSDIITHQNSNQIVEAIKIQFKNIRGKRLKLLLLVFQELGLLQKERIAKKFHDLCKLEFNWEIASYNAMNDYKFNEKVDSQDFNIIKKQIETIIKTN